VTARQASEESESRLLLAAEATGLAIWDLDLKNGKFDYSPQLNALFGLDGEPLTLEGVRSQVHPGDMKNIVNVAYRKALETGHYFYEVRIFWPDKSVHWIRTQGKVHFDADRQPARMLGTLIDITEIKRDEIRKNDFIAMASHELKTPLTTLKAYIQLLIEKTKTSPDSFVKNALLKSGNQVNKMAALIHGFLDLSKLEPGKLQLRLHVFELNRLIEDMITEFLIISSSHQIIFNPSIKVNVCADRDKVGQVLTNLLSNASKYSEKNSVIHVAAEIKQDKVQVSIKDHGIGIKPKDQEKLFQRFYRVENERMKNISGFGIGLYLASEIIQRHKGNIWLESAEGQGSTFYFTLPINAE
jgi:two-component system CheB/CheR fusion protein